jgi:hypothetical protein
MLVVQLAYLKLRIIVDGPRPTGRPQAQRSTAHLIEPQTFFSLVSGEKADNQNWGSHIRLPFF